MKKLSYVIAVSLFVSGTAFAADHSALGALKAAAGPERQTDIPLPVSSAPAPEKALAEDVMDLAPNYSYVLADYAAANGYTVVVLDGWRMTAKDSLLAHAAARLRMPGVPGNWDALIDYMADLPSRLGNDRILVMVRGADEIRDADPRLYADLREVAEFVCANTRDWSRGRVSIKFAFVP